MISIIFDTETTGLLKPSPCSIADQPYIIDICCTKVETIGKDVNKISMYESLVRPPVPISAEIERITGIKDSDVAEAPTFAQIYPDLARFFTGVDQLIAHNLSFDRSMLANEMVRADRLIKFPWPRIHTCTVEKTMYFEQRRLSLTRLHEFLFNCDFPNAHRAKTDVDALYRCYVELVKREVL